MGTQPTVSLRELVEEIKDAIAGLPDDLIALKPYTGGSIPTLRGQVTTLFLRINGLLLNGKAENAVPDNVDQVRWAAENLLDIAQDMQLLISAADDHRSAQDVKAKSEWRKAWTECIMSINSKTERCLNALRDLLVLANALDGDAQSSAPGTAEPADRSDWGDKRDSPGEIGAAS